MVTALHTRAFVPLGSQAGSATRDFGGTSNPSATDIPASIPSRPRCIGLPQVSSNWSANCQNVAFYPVVNSGLRQLNEPMAADNSKPSASPQPRPIETGSTQGLEIATGLVA
jgi:hypothetical protein